MVQIPGPQGDGSVVFLGNDHKPVPLSEASAALIGATQPRQRPVACAAGTPPRHGQALKFAFAIALGRSL